MRVNVADCDLDEVLERGAFRHATSALGERLGATVAGASVYELEAGEKRGPYHYHHGVEEWMYVVSGAPIHRDGAGERTLEPGDLVAFASGPDGAHTVHGPGRVVIFSTGVNGWGEAFVTIYPDSNKIAAAPGVMFRRADAIESWREPAPPQTPLPGPGCPTLNVMSISGHPLALGSLLGAQTWSASLWELVPGESADAYHYEWCREEWLLVLSGAPTLRHPDGEAVLAPADLVCFPQGPGGACDVVRRLSSGRSHSQLDISPIIEHYQ